MGSRIAAHLANAGIDCLLLDLPSEGSSPKERNAVGARALKALGKSRPPAYFTSRAAKHLRVGNFEDDLERLADADWIIEAIIEKYEPKRSLLEKIDKIRKPGTLISTNTSGLPVGKLAEGLSEDFRKHWLGTHFFNPPRYMRLLEIIPGPDTAPEVLDFVEDFADQRLGKAVVYAKDRPNFIANRIFLFSVMQTLRTMMEQGLTVEEVDALTGPLIGRPRMATFRLADFTGIDICVHVAGNLYELVPEDERRDVYQPPEFLTRMVAEGIVGDKGGRGFYKKDRKAPGGRLVLDLDSLQYRERIEPDFARLRDVKKIPEVGARIEALISEDDRAGKFGWKILSELFLYAAARVPEVCDDIVSVDETMKAGFNWKRGIFEIWNDLGVEKTTERMKADGLTLPPLVEKVLASEKKSFYGFDGDQRTYFDLTAEAQQPVEEKEGVLRLDAVKRTRKPARTNPGASVWDLGDGVALLEFHSKANSLDQNVFDQMAGAMQETAKSYDALVIGNQGEHFSVGANIQMVLGLSLEKKWKELEAAIARVQGLICSLRTFEKPVVGAVFGRTLGGGCEVALRCDHVQAAAETYMGLVEVGVGLIPGGGGCTELIRRAVAGLDARDNLTPSMIEIYDRIGTAKVSNSAAEAREWRLLRRSDDVTANSDRLIAEAKAAALGLVAAGYEPPEETEILVGGKGMKASFDLRVWMMRQAHWASDYDMVVAGKLGNVLAGGELSEPGFVSEAYLLGLEREAFLSLCGEEKTLQRIEHTLKTGKPLRN